MGPIFRRRSFKLYGLAAIIVAAVATAGQAQASSSSLTISQARHLIMRYTNYHGATWDRHIRPCTRGTWSGTFGSSPFTGPAVRCRLSEYGERVSNSHLFVGPVVQQWKVVAGGFYPRPHLFLVSQHETPLPLHFSVTIDPNVQQSSGHDENGPWWSAVYSFNAGASAGTMNLGAIRELPNGQVSFSAPGGSYGAGEPQRTSCSYPVGSGVTAQNCLIVYRHPGTYQVTAQYTPEGASPVSVTESVNIG